MKCFSFFLIIILQHITIFGHGFGAQTLVQDTHNSWHQINMICHRVIKKKIYIASYDTQSLRYMHARVTHGGWSETNCYVRFCFQEDSRSLQQHNQIMCTPTQEFYKAQTKQWIPAYMLKAGDLLLCANNSTKTIASISLIKQPLDVFTLEVHPTHVFCVTQHAILTHNMVLPAAFNAILTIPLGTATGATVGSFLGAPTFLVGAVVGCVIGVIIKIVARVKIPKYTLQAYNSAQLEPYINSSNMVCPSIVIQDPPKDEEVSLKYDIRKKIHENKNMGTY